jgi:hypothetical protein
VLLVLGVVGTAAAYWSVTSTVNAGTIRSGTLDLQLQTPASGTTWVHAGLGTATTDQTIVVQNLTPGEGQTFNFAARNAGDVPLTYTATVAQAGTWTYVGDPILVRVYAGGRAGPEDTTVPIQETCTGTPVGSALPVTAGGVVALPEQLLAVGAAQQLCVQISMAAGASSANQGASGSLRLRFDAEQVL